jgi:hypothetical protein
LSYYCAWKVFYLKVAVAIHLLPREVSNPLDCEVDHLLEFRRNRLGRFNFFRAYPKVLAVDFIEFH